MAGWRDRIPPWAQGLVDQLASISRHASSHRTNLSAGGLAFFVSLSIAPAAVVVGWIAGLLVDPSEVQRSLAVLAGQSPGLGASLTPFVDSLGTLVEQASGTTFTVATIVSLLLAVYASSRMVYGLRLALSTAFNAHERYSGGIERLVSSIITLIGLVVAVAILVAVTVVPRVLAALGLGDVRIFTGVGVIDWGILLVLLWAVVRWLISRTSNAHVRVPWWSPGPIVAALWMIVASMGVGIYVQLSSALGAAIAIFGSAIVVLLWLYLCFLGLLYGAEIEAERQRRAMSSGLNGDALGGLEPTGSRPTPGSAREPARCAGDQCRDECAERGARPHRSCSQEGEHQADEPPADAKGHAGDGREGQATGG
jgi:membrane protein